EQRMGREPVFGRELDVPRFRYVQTVDVEVEDPAKDLVDAVGGVDDDHTCRLGPTRGDESQAGPLALQRGSVSRVGKVEVLHAPGRRVQEAQARVVGEPVEAADP